MRWRYLLFLVMLLCGYSMLPTVFAEDTEVDRYGINDPIDLSVHVSDYSGEINDGNCSIRIQYTNYTTVIEDRMLFVGRGYYNYTYNTSNPAYYLCVQNCTRTDPTTSLVDYTAGTCDFIVEGDDNMTFGIIFVTIFVICFYLYIVFFLRKEMFTEHGGIKLFIVILLSWLLLVPINIAIEYNVFNAGPTDVNTMLETIYRVMIYANFFLTFYFVLFFIIQIINKVRNRKGASDHES